MLANKTIATGVALTVLGLAGYFGAGAASLTALIPAAFGVVLAALGAIARNDGRRKLAMHVAVVVALAGFFGSVSGLVKLPRLVSGGEVARPLAVVAQSIMALLTAYFVVLCVKSFIDARRQRPEA